MIERFLLLKIYKIVLNYPESNNHRKANTYGKRNKNSEIQLETVYYLDERIDPGRSPGLAENRLAR